MIVDNENWKGLNVGVVLPIVGTDYSIGNMGNAPGVGAMPAGDVRKAMYKKVKSSGNSNPSRIGFRVYHAKGFGKGELTGGSEIFAGSVMKSSPSSAERASTCAEHTMYEEIKDKLNNEGYLVVTQDLAPCRECISSYSGLAARKRLAIIVYFEQGYDILKQAPGALLFDSTGATYWFD